MAKENAKVMVNIDDIDDLTSKMNELMDAAGVSEKDRTADCTPAASVKRGDVILLKGIRKVRQNADNGFLPCTFMTEDGKQIGCKHFSNVEGMPEGAPGIGRTVSDAARFAVYCITNKIAFEVTSIRDAGDGEYKDEATGEKVKYQKRDISLAVAV